MLVANAFVSLVTIHWSLFTIHYSLVCLYQRQQLFFENVATDDAIVLAIGYVVAAAMMDSILSRLEGLRYSQTVGFKVARSRYERSDLR